MALERDKTRIPVGAALIKMNGTGETMLDVGHLVEDTLKVNTKQINISDEFGNKVPVAVEITVEFEMLQGDYTTLTDLDTLLPANVDIEIHPKAATFPYYKIADIPFNYDIEQTHSPSKARTVKVYATTKALQVTDVISEVTS